MGTCRVFEQVEKELWKRFGLHSYQTMQIGCDLTGLVSYRFCMWSVSVIWKKCWKQKKKSCHHQCYR